MESNTAYVDVFPSLLGFMALRWHENRVARLTFGHATALAAVKALGPVDDCRGGPPPRAQKVRGRLISFAAGRPDDFRDVPLALPELTKFQARVLEQCRRIRYGQTATYAELATTAGSPRAARAVGSVMSQNCVPLIVPCHRVVGANGGLGGYSAPDGLAMKKRLLALEKNNPNTRRPRSRAAKTPA